MDLQYLLDNYLRFSYEAKRYLDVDERPIKPYKGIENIIEITSKKIIIFYFDSYIDTRRDYFENIPISFNDDKHSIDLEIKGKSFVVDFQKESDYTEFVKYYKKYAV